MKKNLLVCFFMLFAFKVFCQSGFSISEVKISTDLNFPELNQKIEYGKDSCILIKEFSNDGNVRMTGKWNSMASQKKDGRFTYFDDSMKPIAIGTYSDNMPIGVWQYFDENGNIVKQLNYSQVYNFIAKQEKIDKFYLLADNMPEFKADGYNNFSEYLSDNLTFPINAIKEKVSEKISVSFIINTEGNLVNPQIVKGQNLDLSFEILRVMSESPQWVPGTNKRGKPMDIKFTYPINFKNKFSNINDYVAESIIGLGYKGGALGFKKDVIMNIGYPDSDKENGNYGVSISEIQYLNSGDVISVNVINSLSQEIDNNVTKALKELIEKNWNPILDAPDTIVIYMPIIFQISGHQYNYSIKNRKKMIDLVYVTLNSNEKGKSLETFEYEIRNTINKNEYSVALELISNYLKKDPFNIEIRNLEILCLKNIGKEDVADQKLFQMQNYIDNKSIEELCKSNTP